MLRVRQLPPSSMGEANKDAIDPWSLLHFLVGVAGGQVLSFPAYLGALAVYEAIEFAHEYPKGSVIFGSKMAESGENVIFDTILGVAGYMVGKPK